MRSPLLECVANVEKDLEVELLAPVREIERGHLSRITGGFGTLESVPVHVVEVCENPIAGAGHAGVAQDTGSEAWWTIIAGLRRLVSPG